MKPKDPVSENMDILNGEPVKPFEYQDHAAHITVHMSMIQDPKVQELAGQAPNADAMQAALSSHVIEHIGFEYRKQIEEEIGTTLPPIGEPLPPEIESRLSTLIEADLKIAGAKAGADIAKVSAQERTKGAEIGRKMAEIMTKDNGNN